MEKINATITKEDYAMYEITYKTDSTRNFNHVLSSLMGLNEPVSVDISKLKVGNLGDPNNETFDVVEAFHRMLLGRKVRRVDWEPEEWIELAPKYYIIRNQRGATMNLSILVCLESREAMWEEYEEYVYLVKAESLDDAYDVASDYTNAYSFNIRPLGEILDELENYPAQCLGGHAE